MPDLDAPMRHNAAIVLLRHRRGSRKDRRCRRCGGLWLPQHGGIPAGCRRRRAIAAALAQADLLDDILRRLLGLAVPTEDM